MSQVFFSFVNEDKDTALRIIDAVQRAGFSVWHPFMISPGESWVQRINDEIEVAKCIVVLWSTGASQSEFAQAEIQRGLRGWSSNRLVLVVLDNAELPIGLRDLPAISLKNANDAAAISELVDHVWTVAERETEQVARSSPLAAAKSRWSSRLIIAAAAACFVLCVVLIEFLSSYEAALRPQVAAPAPSIPEVQPGPAPDSLPSPLPYIAIALHVGLVIGALSVWGWIVWSSKRSKSTPSIIAAPLEQSPQGGDAQVFVSYSRQDGQTVDQLVEQIRQLGYTVWIDRQSTGSQRYAAQIVPAIRASRLVALMCSAHAFTSDHVIREIYVAGDNKKPFIVFLLEATEFPDEVLYFVSGFPRIAVASLDPEQLRSETTRLAVVH